MHGGFNGLLEAAIRGVPVVAIPFFADQFRNARTAEHRGFGIALQKHDFNGQNLMKALKKILYDPSYKQSALRISKLIRTKPFKADERFIEWTNFVIENGRLTNLDVVGANLNFVVYHNLDVIAVLVTILAAMVYVSYRITRRLLGAVLPGKTKVD
uniref:glucuronosyltransferase n=1 Tax=Steinernema glaseri TaxID=37863 RepID=A0A1I7ZRB3_9BILA